VLAFLRRRCSRIVDRQIKQYLFAPISVAAAFIVGGFLILWIESRKRMPHVPTVDDIRRRTRPGSVLRRPCPLIPGTSRSAHHHGGLLRGLSRPAATEFSLLSGDPTIFARRFWSYSRRRHSLAFDDLA